MRIAFAIFRYFPFGGLQRDMLAMAQEARARGHQVAIFCGEWQGDKPKNIDVVLVNASSLFSRNNVKRFVDNFTACFPRNNFDLLVGFNKMPGLDVYFAGDSCFAQKAYEERGFFYRLTARARLYLAYEKSVFGADSPTQIFSIADTERNYFARYYATAPERFHSLPPGISRAQFHCDDPQAARQKLRAEWRLDESTPIVLCVGSGFRTKGLARSIAAFAELQRRLQKKCLLLVVGADNAKAYRAQAQQLGLAGDVLFLGGRSDIANLFQAADLLLHPAYRELAGNVILEAMLAGKPVVTSDACGFAHYVTEGQMGHVIQASCPLQTWVDALVDVLGQDKNVWRDSARRFALEADVFSRQLRALDILQHLVTRPAPEWTADSAEHKIVLRDELIAAWANQDIFALVQQLSGPVARELADRQTLRFELNGQGYYRKLHRGVGWREIFKNLLQGRLPVLGAKNEWLALNKLRALAIPSLEAVAYGEQKTDPARRKSFIVTRELKNVIQLDHYFQQQNVALCEKKRLLDKVAKIARELHGAGINHRDFYLCHFMLDTTAMASPDAEPNLYLVDLHRAQIRRQVPRRWLIKDISGLYFSALDLGFTRGDYLRFMRAYWQLPLRELFSQQGALLSAIAKRAGKTYRRDFGVLPVVNFAVAAKEK